MELSKKMLAVSLLGASAIGVASVLVVEEITDGDSGRVELRSVDGIRVLGTSGTSWGDAQSVEGSRTRAIDPDAGAVVVPELESGLGVVPGLVEVEGTLEWSRDEFRLDGRDLDMGPDRWLTSTAASGDLDGDGFVSEWWNELTSTLGRTVTVLGDVDDDDIDVFEINGLVVRPLYSEIAPWSDDWSGDDLPTAIQEILRDGLSADQAMKRALEQVAGVVTDVQIDINDDRPYWEIDIRTPSGDVYDVELDALTGRIIEIDRQ
ncbi:MAG: hypothetical protein RLZ37_1694 [Actinomycetota bacterium]|jgi:uncharacterized membrane protein YkoI